MNKYFFLALTITLLGCVSAKSVMFPAYVEPESSLAHAHLTINFESGSFTNNSKVANQRIYRFLGDMSGEYCSQQKPEIVAILNNVAWAAGLNWYADKGKPVNNVTIKIPTHEKFRISAFYNIYSDVNLGNKVSGASIKSSICQLNLGFKPTAGHKYLATYESQESLCKWNLFDISDENNKIKINAEEFPPCIVNKEPDTHGLNASAPLGWFEHVQEIMKNNPELYR